jgi:hypothetical protein
MIDSGNVKAKYKKLSFYENTKRVRRRDPKAQSRGEG